ncbi:MAG: nucleotidyltransferase domain-containing protein [Chloroflexi bacterium]|nr:nucleotidyltransferase domain-containing protein [Chloroflexota bacterium]
MILPSVDYQRLAARFDHPTVHAIVLMGSHARGDAGPYSDIDLVRFINEAEPVLADTGTHLIDDHLVVVSDVTTTEVQTWFTRPEVAVNTITGVRRARALIDRSATFANIQEQAHAFTWDEAFQTQANGWASQQMVGWIEEVHKGLEGLRHNDVGRLLNGLFGYTFGLSKVLQVQRGLLISGDNGFYMEVAAAVGVDSLWTQLRAIAFGVSEVEGRPPSLRERVVAGLKLYVVTANLLGDTLVPAHELLVKQTVQLINEQMATYDKNAGHADSAS